MLRRGKFDSDKKKEIEKVIDELKENAPEFAKAELEELESLLDDVLEMENISLGKRILNDLKSFSIHFLVMYAISMIAFGIFFTALVIPNKWWIFLIGGGVSIILTIYLDFPRNPFRKHFILINVMIFALIIMGMYILNRDVYKVFCESFIWIIYIIIVAMLYFLLDVSIRRNFQRRWGG